MSSEQLLLTTLVEPSGSGSSSSRCSRHASTTKKYMIHSIKTERHPSKPLPADKIFQPKSGERTGRHFIERHRYVYRWQDKLSTSTTTTTRTFALYTGTTPPSPSQIQLHRTAKKRLIAIFPDGDAIEPPALRPSEVPFATIVVLHEELWPPSSGSSSSGSERPAPPPRAPPPPAPPPRAQESTTIRRPAEFCVCGTPETGPSFQVRSRKRRRGGEGGEEEMSAAKRRRRCGDAIVPALVGLIAGIGVGAAVYRSKEVREFVLDFGSKY